MILLPSLALGALAPDITITSPEGRQFALLAPRENYAVVAVGLHSKIDANVLARLSVIRPEAAPADIYPLMPPNTPAAFTTAQESLAKFGTGRRAFLISPTGRIVQSWPDVDPSKIEARLSLSRPPIGFDLAELRDAVKRDQPVQSGFLILFLSSQGVVDSLYSQRISEIIAKCRGMKIGVACVFSNWDETLEDAAKFLQDAKSDALPVLDPGGAYSCACIASITPTAALLDPAGRVAYFGAVDSNSRPRDDTRRYLSDALEAVSQGKTPHPAETMPFGTPIHIQPPLSR